MIFFLQGKDVPAARFRGFVIVQRPLIELLLTFLENHLNVFRRRDKCDQRVVA